MKSHDQTEDLSSKVARLEQELSDAYAFKFPWVGNLGRWEWDYASGRVTCSPKKLEALGYRVGEIEPDVERWTSFLHPDDYGPTMENMSRHLRGLTEVYEVEYRIRDKDGSYRWFYDRGSVLARSPDGKPKLIGGIVFDISERKAAEEKLRTSLDFNERLVAIIAHDLKGPLGAFQQMVRALDPQVSVNELVELWPSLNQSVENLYTMLDTLLEWAKIRQGALRPPLQVVDLAAIATAQARLVQAAARLKAIRLVQDWTGAQPVLADEVSLAIVIRNLLANAIKFSPSHGVVEMTITRHDDRLCLHIRDQGPGLDAAEVADLLLPGAKRSQVGTVGESGHGIGLKLCSELLNLSQGRLEIESQPGLGSVFGLSLPLA